MGRKLILVVLALSAFDVISAEPKCHLSELGTCLDHIPNYLNSLPQRSLPTSEDDVKKMCSATGGFFSCWDDYKSRCMTPIQTEVEAIIMEGVRDLEKRFCTPGSDLSTKYLKHSECLSNAVGSDVGVARIKRIVAMFEKFDDIPDVKKMGFFCCAWNQMYGSVKQAAMDICGAEATSSVEDLLTMAISNLPNVVCQSFDEKSDDCLQRLPADGEQPTGKHNPFVDGLRYIFLNHLDRK